MPFTTVKNKWSVQLAQSKSSAGGSRMTHMHKTHDAGRLLVGVQHNLLSRLYVCRKMSLTSALMRRELEVEPLLIVPGLVRGPQPDGLRDDID